MHPIVLSSSRRGPLFPPLPEDPVSDSSLRESEIISHDSSSSDDETEKAAKRRRMLKHAESYLRGEPLYLHSARLRGPVIKNPWGKAAGQAKRKDSETEGGGIRKRLKRFSIGEEDGREISPTLIKMKKGKGILTSRGTNTIDDVIPEPSTPTRLRTRHSTAANVPERSLSHSPVSRIKSVRNRTLELDRYDSGFNVPKQTDDEFTIALYKTPGKKRPERGPIEVPPVCSPGTFYSRSKPPQISYSSSQETRGSGKKSGPSTSARKSSARKTPVRKPSAQKDSEEQVDLVSDVIVLAIPAPPFPDVDLKKKRLKIDFAAKSPFVGPVAERTKPPKGRRKKKLSIGKENVPEAEKRRPGSILVGDSISLTVLEKSAERAEDTSKDTTEQVLNDWLNKHVAASQGVQLQGVVSRNASIANPPLNQVENHDPTIYSVYGRAVTATTAPIPVFDDLAATAENVETAEVPTIPLEVPLRPASVVISQDTPRTPPLPNATTTQPSQPGSEEPRVPIPPDSVKKAVPYSPTRHLQQPETHLQVQPEPSEPAPAPGPPSSGAEEPLQSQAASWQNTQHQLLAAQKGFFDALQDSPVVFSPYNLAETPGRDLLRPVSYFDNEPSVCETPQLGNHRITNDENMSSPSKTLTGRSAMFRSSGNKDVFMTPFKSTFGEGGLSPLGTAFTPFRAFATPESSPKRVGGRILSPLAFTPMGAPTRRPDGATSIAKGGENFGFGLLDDDEESTGVSFGSSFSPVNFRVPGQQGESQAEDLVEQVMGFMGSGVWNIDEELKKMASAGTPGGTTSTPGLGEEGNGKGKGVSARKRRQYEKRH